MNRFLLVVGCLLPLVIPPSCMVRRVLHIIPEGTLRTQYLIDYDYREDREKLFATMGHLLVFNPGDAVASLAITAYFEDREPLTLTREARGGATSEFNAAGLGIPLNHRFALRVQSSQPVVCQGTEGWTNTGNEYDTASVTRSPRGARETAKSSMGIEALATRWFIADGYIINTKGRHWVRESEWALLLNPGDRPAHVRLALSLRSAQRSHELTIPPQRLAAVLMDNVAAHNEHYGTEFNSDVPIAVQWRREVYWQDSDEIMAFWSVPGVSLSEPAAVVAEVR